MRRSCYIVTNNLFCKADVNPYIRRVTQHIIIKIRIGPPGLGKTTLATIIANELDVGFQQTSGPALQIQGDLTAILTNLRERQVLFLDEIHRMQPVLEEKLYTALEDYKLDIIIGQGPAARTHVMEIRPFTFIGGHDAARAALVAAAVEIRDFAAAGVLYRRGVALHRARGRPR